jgi:hypothetical protein
VIEFNEPPTDANLRGARLQVLEWFDDRVVVASPTDPGLRALASRVASYAEGPLEAAVNEAERGPAQSQDEQTATPPEGSAPTDDGRSAEPEPADGNSDAAKKAPHQAFIDKIDDIRAYSSTEVLTESLTAHLGTLDQANPVYVDIQCWCPEDGDDARVRHAAVKSAVESGAGVVTDARINRFSGLSVIRAIVNAALIRDIAELPHVRRIDRLPRPLLSHSEVVQATPSTLPQVLPPDDDAPVIAVVDSGVRTGHPLIGPAWLHSYGVGSLDPAVDGSGHGTMVASLALYGSLEPLLAEGEPLKAAGRLISVRLLDERSQVDDASLWESQLLDALSLAADAGARVINLSVGDPRRPYKPNRPTPLAAELDEFARSRNVVIVVSAGNYNLMDLPHDGTFVPTLLGDQEAGLLDPASSALALTVGALSADEGQGHQPRREDAHEVAVGVAGAPSPHTRVGPGAGDMVKPDVVAPGGHAILSGMTGRPALSPTTGVLGAGGTAPNRFLQVGAGTSFAAPLVTHAAASALSFDPSLSASAVRALVLASVEPTNAVFEGKLDSFAMGQGRRLVGFGRPDARRSSSSTDHRCVLLAERTIAPDRVHLYRVPVPSSFFASGGWRRESAALAFDPPTRSTRLDYLGTRMQFQVYLGATVEEVEAAYVEAAKDESAEATGDEDAVPTALGKFRLGLEPAHSHRGKGANQFASLQRSNARKPEHGEEYVIAVKSTNYWASNAPQAYALAFVLERDPSKAEIYNELRLAIQTEVEVEEPIEVELQ